MSATQTLNQFDTTQVALAITTAITTIISGFIVQYTRKFKNMPPYFRTHFTFFRNKTPSVSYAAAVFYYIILFIPIPLFLTWIIWAGINHGAYPTVTIIFNGLFIIILFIPVYSQLFYIKIFVAAFFFLIGQSTALGLQYQKNDFMSFYCLTALCLTLNAIFTSLAIWIINSNSWTIANNISKTLKQKIMGTISLWKSVDEPPFIISGGFYVKVINLKLWKKTVLILSLYITGLLILLAYSLIGYHNHQKYQYQATVNSLAAIVTDLISLILIFDSKKAGINPIFNTIGIIIIRIVIVGFTGVYWFAGFFIIYMVLLGKIQRLIIHKYYPVFKEPNYLQKTETNVLTSPELALFLLIVTLGGLIIFLLDDSASQLLITDEMPLGANKLKYWIVGVLLLIKTFAQFFHLLSMNIILRSTNNMLTHQTLYIGCHFCGEYYFFLLISYLGLLGIGFFLYSKIGANIIWLSTVFLPIFYQFYVIFLTNWKLNDYEFFGDIDRYNRKIRSQKDRTKKLMLMKEKILGNLREEQENNENSSLEQLDRSPSLRKMTSKDSAAYHLIREYHHKGPELRNMPSIKLIDKKQYQNWKQEYTFFEAFRKGKLLPSDYKILAGIVGMILTLAGYSITFYFLTGEKDVTGFTITAFIVFFIFCFIPIKKYFQTFAPLNLGQIFSFCFGLIVNYAFGIVSYVLEWNRTTVLTLFWGIINVFLISCYISFGLLRDEGLKIKTYISIAISIILQLCIGVVLIAAFDQLVAGLVFIGIGFIILVLIMLFLINIKTRHSLSKKLLILLLTILILGAAAVMIFSFISPNFEGFYGFSITYLVINVLLLLAALLGIIKDLKSDDERPNFYSPLALPIYKFRSQIKTVIINNNPFQIWLIGWFMFYVYTLLMMIFIEDPNYGISASMLFFAAFMLTFLYFTTYNAYESNTFRSQVNESIMKRSWDQVCELKNDSLLGWFTDTQDVLEQLSYYKGQYQKRKAVSTSQNLAETGQNIHKDKHQKTDNMTLEQISQKILHLQYRFEKAQQNQMILLVNFWVYIKLISQIVKKQKMIMFVNFIRENQDILIEGGIPLILNQNLYELKKVYYRAFEQLHELPSHQIDYFYEQFEKYKKNKLRENIARQRELRKIENQQRIKDDVLLEYFQNNNQQLEQYLGSLEQWNQLKKQQPTQYTDQQFTPDNAKIPNKLSEKCRWLRPEESSVAFLQKQGIKIKQSPHLNDNHIVNALTIIDKGILQSRVASTKKIPGGYLIHLNKFQRSVHIIIDDRFPAEQSLEQDKQHRNWLFSHCQNHKELYCNILQKAYAKLYHGYQNIANGNMSSVLQQLTHGYTESIALKFYKETLTKTLFKKLFQLNKQPCLMMVSTPVVQDQNQSLVCGLKLKYTYKVQDVRIVDGNQLVKLKKPYVLFEDRQGDQQELDDKYIQNKGYNLDWNEESPKWTTRIKALTNYNSEQQRRSYFWMGIDDLVYTFRCLTICHLLDKNWSQKGTIRGSWGSEEEYKNEKQHQFLDFTKFPQYGIKVNEKCRIIVTLRQHEIEGKYGKNKIYFYIEKNKGRRISSPFLSRAISITGQGVKDRAIFKQLDLEANSYPYIFTLMVGIIDYSATGTFSLSIKCSSKKDWEIIKDEEFDR